MVTGRDTFDTRKGFKSVKNEVHINKLSQSFQQHASGIYRDVMKCA